MLPAVDPFLAGLSQLADSTTRPTKQHPSSAAASAVQQQQNNDEDAAMMQGATDTSMMMDDTPAVALSASINTQQRGLAFLQTHAKQYQQRIESLLLYLDDHRFGRPSTTTTSLSIQSLQKSPADLKSEVRTHEAEWMTWLLLIELEKNKTIQPEPVTPSVDERYSRQRVVTRFASQPQQQHELRKISAIIEWLEELQVYLLSIEETGAVNFKTTLRKLQKSTVGEASKEWLDPDVELRLKQAQALSNAGHVFEQSDLEEEEKLLVYVWQLIRAGRLNEAIQLCRTYGQSWRAASLQGGERLHDEGTQQDGTIFRVGNPHHLLWRYTCRKLSQALGVSPVESSIYGLLGGDLAAALKYSGKEKYEDALYCYLRIAMDERVEDFLTKEGCYNQSDARLNLVKNDRSGLTAETSLAHILSSLESPLNPMLTPTVAKQASSPYIRLQKWLMLDDVEAIEREMVHTIRTQYRATNTNAMNSLLGASNLVDNTVNHTYLLFSVHIYLYLHPDCPNREPLNSTGVFLIQTYLEYLESNAMYHALIPYYTQYLSSQQRITYFIRFLKSISSLEERKKLLAILAEVNPENSLEITTGLVQNIIGEEAAPPQQQQLLLTSGATGNNAVNIVPAASSAPSSVVNLLGGNVLNNTVTASDLSKISSIDCFSLTSTTTASSSSSSLEVVQEALIQVTQLYRWFIQREKYASCKRFNTYLSEKMFEHHIFQCMKQQEEKKEQLPSLWHALSREYGHWRLYMKCLHWYDTWLTQHSNKPRVPIFNTMIYQTQAQAKAEYAVFEVKYARWKREEEEWKKSQIATVRSCVQSFLELLECDGGWLNPSEGSLRQSEMFELRRACIPKLVMVLMQVCKESEQQQLCLPVADVIASPNHNLHTCFTHEQLRALLKQFRAAYIDVRLRQAEQTAV